MGDPIDYKNMVVSLRPNTIRDRDEIIHKLIEIQYDRNVSWTLNVERFRVRGENLEIFPASYTDSAIRVEFF